MKSGLLMSNLTFLVNRNKPFPLGYLVGDWSFQDDETDLVSSKLKSVDLSRIRLVTMLKDGEERISGEVKRERLKLSGCVKLDSFILQTLLDNKHLIPESWKEELDGRIRFIFFDGTVLLGREKEQNVLCLYWYWGDWQVGCRELSTEFNDGWNEYFPSAVL